MPLLRTYQNCLRWFSFKHGKWQNNTKHQGDSEYDGKVNVDWKKGDDIGIVEGSS